MTERDVTFPTGGGAQLAGTLATPDGPRAPSVLLLGGTFSDLRDGTLIRSTGRTFRRTGCIASSATRSWTPA